jgi:hypothetical protein
MQWFQDPNQSITFIYTLPDVKLVNISGKKEGISEY